MSAIQEQIKNELKTAMKGGDKPRVATIRLITAAIKQYEVDQQATPDDDILLGLLDKMAKQRRESIDSFRSAGRDDLVEKEEYELGVITEFLPAQLSDEEIDTLIKDALAETGAESMKDMGKVMGILRPQLTGRADMGAVSGRIKAALNG